MFLGVMIIFFEIGGCCGWDCWCWVDLFGLFIFGLWLLLELFLDLLLLLFLFVFDFGVFKLLFFGGFVLGLRLGLVFSFFRWVILFLSWLIWVCCWIISFCSWVIYLSSLGDRFFEGGVNIESRIDDLM